MEQWIKRGLLFLGVSALAACSGTGRYIDSPVLRVHDTQALPDVAVSRLFLGQTGPYAIVFCDADQATGECIEGRVGYLRPVLVAFSCP